MNKSYLMTSADTFQKAFTKVYYQLLSFLQSFDDIYVCIGSSCQQLYFLNTDEFDNGFTQHYFDDVEG